MTAASEPSGMKSSKGRLGRGCRVKFDSGWPRFAFDSVEPSMAGPVRISTADEAGVCPNALALTASMMMVRMMLRMILSFARFAEWPDLER